MPETIIDVTAALVVIVEAMTAEPMPTKVEAEFRDYLAMGEN